MWSCEKRFLLKNLCVPLVMLNFIDAATHRTTGVEVAIKTLSKKIFADIGLKWNNRELELMRFLNHPNIVHL